jgi:hypothetical protein
MQHLVKEKVEFPNEPYDPGPATGDAAHDLSGVAFAGCLPDPLWCQNAGCPGTHDEPYDRRDGLGVQPWTGGRRIDPGPGASYWLVKDVGDLPLDPEGLPGETVGEESYSADEWYACCEACADAIITQETMPEQLPDEETADG